MKSVVAAKYAVVVVFACLTAGPAPMHAATVFTDLYDASAQNTDINLGIADRTFGEVNVSTYNEAGDAWQLQLTANNGGMIQLAPNNGTGSSRVWAGPDYDFATKLTNGAYKIVFDIDPNDYAGVWAGFTFGVNSANQGAWVNANHGGLSVTFKENDMWNIYDGTDGSTAPVAGGSYPATNLRTVMLDVTEHGTTVTLSLSIDGVLQTNYTYTGTFAGNYMAFSSYTDRNNTDSSYFDNFNILQASPYVWVDPYDTSANTNDINTGIYDRASGNVLVNSYNAFGVDSQIQLRTDSGGSLLLEPNANTGFNNKVSAGPDCDFAGELGDRYQISFDVDPNDNGDTWSALIFGVAASKFGNNVNYAHGGLGLLFKEGAWTLYDGTNDADSNGWVDSAARSGTYTASGFRTFLLDVTDSGSDITVDISVNGIFQASYTYTGSFAGNYMYFQGFTSATVARPMYFDNFTIAVPPSVGLGGGAVDILGDSATLRGELMAGDSANAYICWGNAVGGDTTGSWQNVISVGPVGESVFSEALSNLDGVTEYYYRVYVTNATGDAWSPVTNFITKLLLFYDDFDSADSTSLTDPTGRATGTAASSVTYTWTSTTDVQVDGALNWDANGDKNSDNEQPAANGTQSMRIPLNWAPYVAGKVWEVEFDQRVAWSHPLTFGLSDNVQNGVYDAWDTNLYDFAVGEYGVALRYDTDDDGGDGGPEVAGVFPSPPTDAFYNFRIRFDEPNGTATVWIDGVQKAQITTLDFENSGRYLSWGEPTDYAGALDNIKVSAPYDFPAADADDIYNFDLNVVSSDILNGDRAAAGQTFLTGANSTGYMLHSLSFFQTRAVSSTAGTFTMRVGTVSGTTFATNMTETFAGADVTLAGYGNDWVTFTLATPFRLDPNTLYGIDLVRTGGGSYVNWGESGNVYPDGESYISPPVGLGGATITLEASKDRIFRLDLEANPPSGTMFVFE